MSLFLYLIDGVIHSRADKFGRLISPELRKQCKTISSEGNQTIRIRKKIMARVKKAQVHICQ